MFQADEIQRGLFDEQDEEITNVPPYTQPWLPQLAHTERGIKRILRLFGLGLLPYVYSCERKDNNTEDNQNFQYSSLTEQPYTLNSPASASQVLLFFLNTNCTFIYSIDLLQGLPLTAMCS